MESLDVRKKVPWKIAPPQANCPPPQEKCPPEHFPQENCPTGKLPPRKMLPKNRFTSFSLLLTLSYNCSFLNFL